MASKARALPEERGLAVLLDGERVRLFYLRGDLVEELRDPALARGSAPAPSVSRRGGMATRATAGAAFYPGAPVPCGRFLATGWPEATEGGACDLVHRTADRIAQLVRAEHVDRLLAGGAPQCVAELRRILRARLGGDVEVLALGVDASALRVGEAARLAARAEPSSREEEVLGELLDAVGRGLAALGPAPVAEAVNDHAAALLVFARGLRLHGAACPACGSLFPAPAPTRCPGCGAAPVACTDLLELLARRVREGDGAVEEINGPAGDTLRGYGGIAALLRYALPGAGLACPWNDVAES